MKWSLICESCMERPEPEEYGKPKPRGRFFVYTWCLTVVLVGGLIYPVLAAYTMNYLGQTPGLQGIKIAYDVKNAVVRSLGNEPILYVLGGSSAYIGIDAQLMEEISRLKSVVSEQQKNINKLERKVTGRRDFSKGADAEMVIEEKVEECVKKHLPPAFELFNGLEIGIGATGIFQATHNANVDNDPSDEDVADSSYSLDFEYIIMLRI